MKSKKRPTVNRNSRRVARCHAVLRDYLDIDPRTNLIDLLADARHWCDRYRHDFAQLDRIAYQHYLAERTG